MNERRSHRSLDRDEALQLLLESLASKAGGRGVALVDDCGRLLAGAGNAREMWSVAKSVATASESLSPRSARTPRAYVEVADESLRLTASSLDEKVLGAGARSVARILASTHAAA